MIRAQLVAAYPFLGSLSARSKRLVETLGRNRLIRQGASVIRKGDTVGGMYFVVAGRLRVFTMSMEGEQVSLYVVNAGESCLLATSALFAEMQFPAWVEVESKEARIFCIPSAVFRELFNVEQVVRDFTVNILSRRVFDLMTSLEETALFPVGERLRKFLVRAANAQGEVETTHEKIAASLGTSREVITRKLKQLSGAGVIRSQRGRIKLVRPETKFGSR